MLGNRCVLQQHHVDCKIVDALLKKDTKEYGDGWDASSQEWAHMVLHLPHAEGGFSVPFKCVTKDAAFYTTTSRFVVWIGAFPQERQELWLPKDDLRDSSSWSSPPLVLLRDIHSKLLTQFDCKEVCESSPSQVNTGTGPRLSSQDGVPQQQETVPLILPQLNRPLILPQLNRPLVRHRKGGILRLFLSFYRSLTALARTKRDVKAHVLSNVKEHSLKLSIQKQF
jgi:hypothetical protein